jgi:hypothetical protein
MKYHLISRLSTNLLFAYKFKDITVKQRDFLFSSSVMKRYRTVDTFHIEIWSSNINIVSFLGTQIIPYRYSCEKCEFISILKIYQIPDLKTTLSPKGRENEEQM